MAEQEKNARFTMLETLADHDDELMEQLLEDIPPPRDRVFDDLAKELRDGLVCPVLMGAALRTNGVLRLLKALRHEAAGVAETIARLGAKTDSEALALVLKTLHTAHGGKMSLVRVLAGQIGDGTTLSSPNGEVGRVSGVMKMLGQASEKRGQPPPATPSHSGGSNRRAPEIRYRPEGPRIPPLSHLAYPRRCWRSRLPPRSARTTSSSVRRSPSWSMKIPR